MDKRLRELKSHFETEIPTDFTDKDKRAVFTKIKESKQGKRKVPSFLPRALSVAAVAILFVIVLVSLNNTDNFSSSESSNDASMNGETFSIASDENTMEDTSQSERNLNQQESQQIIEESGEDSGENRSGNEQEEDRPMITQQESSERDITSNSANILFDPHSLEAGMSIGDFEVKEVVKQEQQTTITFEGDKWLSGDFYYQDGKLLYNPDNRTLLDFPLARDDKDGNIVFSFQDETLIELMYGAPRGGTPINETGSGFMVEVTDLEYSYHPNGSQISLGLKEMMDIKTEEYVTKMDLNNPLMDTYSQFKTSLKPPILKGLKPIEIFKMYFHAVTHGDQQVQYALYSQEELHGTPDKNTYFNNREKYEANEPFLQDLQPKLQEEMTFKEIIYSPEGKEHAVILFQSEEGAWPYSFQLIKDPNHDVWKVTILPMG